ncbi:uncharacterized, partial [Tachysurus ichikawai]
LTELALLRDVAQRRRVIPLARRVKALSGEPPVAMCSLKQARKVQSAPLTLLFKPPSTM